MFYLAGAAASSALDLISAIEQKVGSKGSPTSPATTQSFDVGSNGATGANGSTTGGGSSATATSPLAPATMNALLSVQGDGQTPVVNGDAFSSQLFGLLDGNGDGAVSQSEFEQVFNRNGDTTKADALFSKLDANHDGSVSPDELTNALAARAQDGQDGQGGGQVHHHHHHHMADAGGANAVSGSGNANDPSSTNSSSDPFAGDQSKTVTNSDGSSTTTITYADGSQVAMTIPATSSTGTSPTAWEHNFIERMIQQQAQMMASSPAGQGFALSA